MSVIGSNILAGASGQGGFTIEESLRFNASQSSYLSWTPASAGNRKTWTFSAWVKRGQLGTTQQIFYAKDGTNYVLIGFTTNNQLQIQLGTPRRRTVRVFRDPSAWYHIVGICDTTNATGDDRLQLWVNGERQTSFDEDTDPTLNSDSVVSNTVQHNLGRGDATHYADGYLTEVNFIDGQALDPSSFGAFDSVTGVWKPVEYTGTYGTNGFYLPMQLDNTVEGFNTVTWVGNGSTQKISGVGFSPDLVWIKERSSADNHMIFDSVRGVYERLQSNTTNAEATNTTSFTSFDTDGFALGTDTAVNANSSTYVGWCWDAGSSTVSNTDGSITSSVRANPTYGFSVVTYTGTGTSTGDSFGHALGVQPKMVIIKNRTTGGTGWAVLFPDFMTSGQYMALNLTNGITNSANAGWGGSLPDSTQVYVGGSSWTNASGNNYVAYCFSEVAGYSKFGSYAGTGASGNTVTTGFKPAFVLFKRTDTSGYSWYTFDSTRNAVNPVNTALYPDLSNTDTTQSTYNIDFTDTGFTINNSNNALNASGGTYIYMAFKDTREYAYWLDDSGNNNDWQPNGGITTESTVTDTPTPYEDGGNYAVLNPVNATSAAGTSLSNGNLQINGIGSGNVNAWIGTLGVSSGKWYYEVIMGENNGVVGISQTGNPNTYPGGDATSYGYATSTKYNNNTSASYGASLTAGDVVGCAYDLDAGTITFYKNGVSQGQAYSGLSGNYFPAVRAGSTGAAVSVNFGQRPFAYTPPTGFLPLHTGNLPDSAVVDGSQYFNPVLYTGTGSATQPITGVGFQPDLSWIKVRSTTGSNWLTDNIRGATKILASNLASTEATVANTLKSFDSDGFTVGDNAEFGGSARTYVAWNWKANGAGVSNTDGSITSTVSANPTAGFSIVSYTGNATNNATVGHGLGALPNMVIVKNRDSALDWAIWHTSLSTGQVLRFSTLAATVPAVAYFQDENNTSSVFALGANDEANGSSNSHVAYCFADVEGYSKFGSYTGNGSTDGTFVYLGFRPAFVLGKRTDSTGNWLMLDTARDTTNPNSARLFPNLSNAEDTSEDYDFLSNGFKPRGSYLLNASGGTYIYMAFAENPFKNSLAR